MSPWVLPIAVSARIRACSTPAALAVILVALISTPAFAQQADAASAASAGSEPIQPERKALPPLPAGEPASIPVPGTHGLFGGDVAMAARVFLPPGNGPFPVVVFSHGRAPVAADRARLRVGISNAQLRYWLARGDAVVAPIRPGYGETGGGDPENSGTHFDKFGQCTVGGDFRKTAVAGERAVEATLAWLHSQPWADVHHVLLVGQSVGGLTTVAAGSQRLDGVVGYINFAGGTGGNPSLSPGRSCDPEQLSEIYRVLGRQTILPNLWIYAENDEFWGPDVPVAWHAAFAAGGSRTTFVHAPPVATGSAHGLSSHASSLWAPYVDTFLATIDFPVMVAGAR
jgi:dienelactone hydrolase